jgi:ABC-type Na+ efflux pump permease subunit
VLKKEFQDTLKTLFYCLLLFLIVPIARLLDMQVLHSEWEISGIWQPVFTAVIIFFTAYSGISIFQVEKRDRALEYLLSLPLSKWKIIGAKVFPRLIMVLVLTAAGSIFSVLNNAAADGMGLLILFFSGLFISLAVDSLLNGLFGVIIINITFYYASLIISYITMRYRLFGSDMPLFLLSYLLPAVLLLVPLAAAFALTVKHMDIRPFKWQVKYYLVIALPAVLLLLAFIMVFMHGYFEWVRQV